MQRSTNELITRREAAGLIGTPMSAIDKAVEQKVVKPRRIRHETFLDLDEVAVLVVLRGVELSLPTKLKKTIRRWLLDERPHRRHRTAELALGPVIFLRFDTRTLRSIEHVEDYLEARERWIELSPTIKGGEPVIRGTRIGVRAVAGRIGDGDRMDDLIDDYPGVPREAFEAAVTWARLNPPRGRPRRQPWVG